MRHLVLFLFLAVTILAPTAGASNLVIWNLVGVNFASADGTPGSATGWFAYSPDTLRVEDWNITVAGADVQSNVDPFPIIPLPSKTFTPTTSDVGILGVGWDDGVTFISKADGMNLLLDLVSGTPLTTIGNINLNFGGASRVTYRNTDLYGSITLEDNVATGHISSAVPEPGVCFLAGTGLVGLALLWRKTARSA